MYLVTNQKQLLSITPFFIKKSTVTPTSPRFSAQMINVSVGCGNAGCCPVVNHSACADYWPKLKPLALFKENISI